MNKYSFRNMVGNSNTLSLIERMLDNGTFSKFTIFEGTLGTGKSTASRIAAMRLTCENPIGGHPCCKCPTCLNNMKAFESTGESTCVKVVNLAAFENRSEVRDLIHDVFVLQAGSKARVYVLEEAHVLRDLNGAQTAFLEEIDRMPPNTYVIMCTTRAFDVIDELASRALVFPFRRLNTSQSLLLAKRESAGALQDGVINLVVKSSKGIPRKIINSIDFIKNNAVTEEEYREFINEISDSMMITLFQSMESPDMRYYVDTCSELMEKRMPATVYSALKQFMLQALFTLEGATTEFSSDTADAVKILFTTQQLDKSLRLLSKYDNRLNEADLQFLLYQLRLLLQQRTVADVYKDSTKVASVAKERVKEERYEKSASAPATNVLTKLDIRSINSFGEMT